MSRRQVRRMIRLESVTISVFGAMLRLGVSPVFAVTLQRVLADDGIEVLSIPTGHLVAYVVAAALIGWSPRCGQRTKASRLDVLAAIASE